MQGSGKCGVEGYLEPGWSERASPRRYLLRKSPQTGRSQTWDNQGRTFEAEGTENAEALRWEGRECAEASGGKEFRFFADTGEVLSRG